MFHTSWFCLNPNEEKVPDGVSVQVDLAKRSYLALAKVLDLLRSENDVTAALRVKAAIEVHVKARLQAYGERNFQPKCHYCQHLGDLLQKHRLLCCWVHERKHKELKRYASDSHNANLTNSYEKGLLRQVLLTQLNSLQDLFIGEKCQLIKPSPAPSGLEGHLRRFLNLSPVEPLLLEYSKTACLHAAATCSYKDVVLCCSDELEKVGEVWFFVNVKARDQNLNFLLWSPWITLGRNRFTRVDEPEFIDVECVKRCCTFCIEPSGTALVVP